MQVLGGKELEIPPRCGSFAGFSLHAGMGFKEGDRAGLERLCRYILRPPLVNPSAKWRALDGLRRATAPLDPPLWATAGGRERIAEASCRATCSGCHARAPHDGRERRLRKGLREFSRPRSSPKESASRREAST